MEHSPPAAVVVIPALRTATQEIHRQLEQTVDIERCLEDRARYVTLLQTFLGFYRPLENRLAALGGWPQRGVNWAIRRKTPWLAADLQALGAGTEPAAGCPDARSLPPAETLSQGFGCLYVLEGATLGGRQITALLERSSIPLDARRFFGGYGPETGARWREFVAALEEEAAAGPAATTAEIVDAARQTFVCLHHWTQERMPPA